MKITNLMMMLFLILSTAGAVFSQVPPGTNPGGMSALPKNGKITGKIIDAETKTPMEYANVAIYSKKDSKLGTGDKYGTDLMLSYKTKKYNVFLGGNWNDETNYGTMNMTRETYLNDTTTILNTDGRRDQVRGGNQLKGGFDYYLTDKTSLTLSTELGNYNFDSYGGGNLHNYQQPGGLNIYSVQNNKSGRSGNYMSANASFQTKFDETGLHKLDGSFNFRTRDSKENETIDEYESDASYRQTTNYLSRIITAGNSTSNDYRMKLDYTLPLKEGARFEAVWNGKRKI